MKAWRVLLAAAVMLAAQSGRGIPPYEGDDNPSHDGQPKWCQRDDRGGFKANCHCKAMGGDGEGMCDGSKPAAHGDPKCSTYCRRTACACHSECAPTR